jgi:hypothetical protein
MEDHMKTLQLCAATLLSLALAVSAFAGHVDCPPVVEPTSTTSATGTVDSPGVASTNTSSALTEVIVTIVSLTY